VTMAPCGPWARTRPTVPPWWTAAWAWATSPARRHTAPIRPSRFWAWAWTLTW